MLLDEVLDLVVVALYQVEQEELTLAVVVEQHRLVLVEMVVQV
jgi:hypothetical protein